MAKKKVEVINKTYLTPHDANTIWNNAHENDHSNLVVDFSLFYTDHCKVHPIDLLFNHIKKCAQENEDPICYFYKSMVFNHHEWEETDTDHLRHYQILADNIMHELWIYLLKAGWRVTFYDDPDSDYRKFFKICF